MPDLTAFTAHQFWGFLQVLVRISAMVAVAPVFGAAQVPAQVKVGLSLILSLVLLPVAEPSLSAAVPNTLFALLAPIAGQAVIGLLLGFIVSLTLVAVQLAGSLLDLQIGFSLAQVLNPTIGQMVTPVAQLEYLYALLLFLLANGHYMLLSALAHSFALLPVSAMNLGGGSLLRFISDATFTTLVSGLRIAAPAAGVLLVMDVTMAFLARAVPQMNVFFVGMPAKVLVSFLLLAVVLPFTAYLVGQMIAGSQFDLVTLMRGLRHA